MLVLMAFIMILKNVNIRSIKNGIKELRMTKQELIDKYQEKKKKIDDFYKDQTYHDQGYWQSVAKYEVIEEILKDLEKLD